jgi:hypothetical protein
MSTNDDEYTKLYNLLSSLSSKSTGTNPVVTPMISLMDIPIKTLVISESMGEPSIKKEEIPVTKNIVYKPVSELEELMLQTTHHSVSCEACLKTFPNTSLLQSHHRHSEMCAYFIGLPNKTDYEVTPISIHVLVDELLSKAVTEEGTTSKCPFCKTTFSTKGNLHKHFHHAVVCNRMAYVRFKQIVGALA